MTRSAEPVPAPVFQTQDPWSATRPETLVVACSDGRLQEETDCFLQGHLGITHYDRFYVPGGAGALASTGTDVMRAYELLGECRLLAAAHASKRVILLFHGPAADGPDDAVCLAYCRKLPGRSADDIRRHQDSDAEELLGHGIGPGIAVSAYRVEVRGDGIVQVVPLQRGGRTDRWA
jgi:hypothetical protein